jgi:Intra-flagellar transport protein 57
LQSSCFQQWEDALDKLKALDYENDFCKPRNLQPFTRNFFAMPAENAGLQFRSFQEVTTWLINLCTGGNDMYKIDKVSHSVSHTTSSNFALRFSKLHVVLSGKHDHDVIMLHRF